MTSSTTITKKGIRNHNLHGSYEHTSDFANSLKVEAVIKEITVFYEPINTNLRQNESKFFGLSRHIPKVWIFLFRNKKIKTNFTIGGFVNGQPWSPLIICLSLSGPQVHKDSYHPTYWFFENYHIISLTSFIQILVYYFLEVSLITFIDTSFVSFL